MENAALSAATIMYAIGGLVALILVIFVLSGLKLIRDNEVGIPTKKMLGKRMPQGRVIAQKDEVGIQARTLNPGLYWFMPFIWRIKRVEITVIATTQVGVVEAIDGDPIPTGRLLGDEVECNSFQDAESFLFPEGGKPRGKKGPQVGFLRPGRYRINTSVFRVTPRERTHIPEEKLGVVVAIDGKPLDPKYLIAPKPDDTKGSHNFFQNGQAFLNADGYRGPQLDTLQPGDYYINPLLFDVKIGDIAEVMPGYVAVLRSNVGVELVKDATKPGEVPDKPALDQAVHDSQEVVLTTDKLVRGIWREPVAPGKYNMNWLAFTPFLVPTSAVTIDWATSEVRGEYKVDEADTRPKARNQQMDIPEADSGERAKEFFKFSQLRVTSKDGFTLDVDVRMIIRISPEHAAFVIARFGSVKNLIEQIVHPLIDSSFRNKAGEKKAIDFIQERTKLQLEALEKAREEFVKYHVEAQGLLIAYISADERLLATQKDKEIALQQQTQYTEQAKAEEKRIELTEKKARADKQGDVIAAKLSIEISADNAQAAVKKAEGDRDSIKIVAEGKAFEQIQVGEGLAKAYKAQADVIGQNNLAALKIVEQIASGKIKVTPDMLITGGGADGQGGLMMNALVATLLSERLKPTAAVPAAPAAPAESAS